MTENLSSKHVDVGGDLSIFPFPASIAGSVATSSAATPLSNMIITTTTLHPQVSQPHCGWIEGDEHNCEVSEDS
jgi:hypothetical protein